MSYEALLAVVCVAAIVAVFVAIIVFKKTGGIVESIKEEFEGYKKDPKPVIWAIVFLLAFIVAGVIFLNTLQGSGSSSNDDRQEQQYEDDEYDIYDAMEWMDKNW